MEKAVKTLNLLNRMPFSSLPWIRLTQTLLCLKLKPVSLDMTLFFSVSRNSLSQIPTFLELFFCSLRTKLPNISRTSFTCTYCNYYIFLIISILILVIRFTISLFFKTCKALLIFYCKKRYRNIKYYYYYYYIFEHAVFNWCWSKTYNTLYALRHEKIFIKCLFFENAEINEFFTEIVFQSIGQIIGKFHVFQDWNKIQYLR